jgi:hypothetical protein
MADHTLQRELDPIAHRRPERRQVRRSGTPLMDLALELQRQAGNRSVAELIRHDATPMGRGAMAGTLAAIAGSSPAGQLPTTRRAAAATVQREPCADCPDNPVAAMPDPDGLPETTAAS